ncbi:MAG: pilus assembly protein [Deltaproteobacteria bacterium]|nr:MAG: pilus assembly protein [Deltaproteobacteria bacterium]
MARVSRSPFTRRARRGASAVEFALLFPMVTFMVFGALEFSWYISTQYDVQRAAREGARIGSATLVRPDESLDQIRDAATLRAMDVLESRGRPCSVGCAVEAELFMFEGYQHIRVRVVYPHSRLVPNMGIVDNVAIGSFVMLTQQQQRS